VRVCSSLSSPHGQGTASSFYRPRRGGLQSCRMALSATYGGMAQFHGSDSRPDESCLWWASWRILCPSRGGFEGSSAGALVWSPSVRLFEGWVDERPEAAQRQAWRCPIGLGSHSVGDDAAVRGMVAQRGGDGHTGPKVMEETRSAGLMSRRRPRLARSSGRTPFEGATILFRGVRRGGGMGVDRTVSSNDTGLPAQYRTASGMATQCGLVEQRRDMIPRRCQRTGVAGIRL
jgi:hypothetical protein